MIAIIKRVKQLGANALIASRDFREYVEKQETEINRGISSLCVLSIIMQSEEKELHGYKILKDLTKKTNKMLVIEEGTLYPLLRKLEHQKIIDSRKEETGRSGVPRQRESGARRTSHRCVGRTAEDCPVG